MDRLIPLIFISHRTHLWHFASDIKDWPVYKKIGNLSLKCRQVPSTQNIRMVAPLPIAIINLNIPQTRLDEQWHTN
jgi:hypothetical protein